MHSVSVAIIEVSVIQSQIFPMARIRSTHSQLPDIVHDNPVLTHVELHITYLTNIPYSIFSIDAALHTRVKSLLACKRRCAAIKMCHHHSTGLDSTRCRGTGKRIACVQCALIATAAALQLPYAHILTQITLCAFARCQWRYCN